MRLGLLLLTLCLVSCSGFQKPGSEVAHVYSKIYLTDYNTAWQSALDALKNFDHTIINRQGGIIQTAWIDNTAQKNFTDTFGGGVTYLKAKFRMNLVLAQGNYNSRPSVKITIQKDQLVQQDLLEGWTQVQTDSIDENTILYRIGRLIYIKLRMKQMEEERTNEILQHGV